MARVINDDIDFGAYMRDTEASVKVRRASAFGDDLLQQFQRKPKDKSDAAMESTKLGHLLEFRPGEVTCWAGYNGHRKSMFTGQVALDLCAQGQRVLVKSFEMLPARTLARMARQAAAQAFPHPHWLSAFARWTDDRLWLFDHIGRLKPQESLAVCRYFADELKGQHVIIDSMMMVCASEESLDEQKQFVTDMVRMAQETKLHIHLVAHCRKPQSGEETRPPTKYDIRGAAAISDQVHNVVLVWANKGKKVKLEKDEHDEAAHNEPDALVIVDKQRNGAWEGRCRLWFHEQSLRFCDDRTSPVLAYPVQEEAPR